MLMSTIQAEGELQFKCCKALHAFNCIVEACNTYELFQINSARKLSVSTVKKKLYIDWIPFFSKACNSQSNHSLTGASGGDKSRVLEDIMVQIIASKNTAEGSWGLALPGQGQLGRRSWRCAC